jgi:hypothetical protein
MVVERFASVVDELGDATGLPVVGLPMHFGGCDERTHLAAISARMRRPGALRIISAELGARDALGVLARATVACGISYHSAVFSLLSGVPFIGIYKGGHYTQKFDGLSQLYEVADLAVPLDAVGPGTIARAVAARLAGAVPLRARLAARNAALLDAVRRPRRALVEAVERAGEGPPVGGAGPPSCRCSGVRDDSTLSARTGASIVANPRPLLHRSFRRRTPGRHPGRCAAPEPRVHREVRRHPGHLE